MPRFLLVVRAQIPRVPPRMSQLTQKDQKQINILTMRAGVSNSLVRRVTYALQSLLIISMLRHLKILFIGSVSETLRYQRILIRK